MLRASSAACTVGQFYDADTSTCLSCISNCDNCADGSSCSLCSINYYYNVNQCVTAAVCPSNTYTDASLRICAPCRQACATCSNYNMCLSCLDTSYKMDEDKICFKIYAECHASCQYCVDNKYSSCVQCSSDRTLTKLIGYSFGWCDCKSGTLDELDPSCKSGNCTAARRVFSSLSLFLSLFLPLFPLPDTSPPESLATAS